MNNDPRWLHLHTLKRDNFIPVSRITNVSTDFDKDTGALVSLFHNQPIAVDESPKEIMELMSATIIKS